MVKRAAEADDYEPDFNPPCPHCGGDTRWEDCTEFGCDDGAIDRYEEDPLWFVGPMRFETCENCEGRGGWYVCANSYAWCQAHPLPGQEQASRFIVGAELAKVRRCSGWSRPKSCSAVTAWAPVGCMTPGATVRLGAQVADWEERFTQSLDDQLGLRNEIERLQAESEREVARSDALSSEVERLRAALVEIRRTITDGEWMPATRGVVALDIIDTAIGG